jgi:plasmid stabilization system protein ParE
VKSYFVAPEAEADLRQIWRHLFIEASLEVADRIQEELLAAFEELAEFPGKGHKRPDLTKRDVLFFTVYQYMIVYRSASTIEVIAVLHGKRDVKRILMRRPSR